MLKIDVLENRIKELESLLALEKNRRYENCLSFRLLLPTDNICPICHGSGVRVYGDSATWRRGRIAAQVVTTDVCDNCWGSGNIDKKWANLKEISNKIKQQESR